MVSDGPHNLKACAKHSNKHFAHESREMFIFTAWSEFHLRDLESHFRTC